MALRMLSGIIDVKDAPRQGNIGIRFDPHERLNGSTGAFLSETKTTGPAGRFNAVPHKLIALRQTMFFDTPRIFSVDIRWNLADGISQIALPITP